MTFKMEDTKSIRIIFFAVILGIVLMAFAGLIAYEQGYIGGQTNKEIKNNE